MEVSEKSIDDKLILNKVLAVAPDIRESFIDRLFAKGLMNGKILLAIYNPLLRTDAFFNQSELDFNKFQCRLSY